MKKMTLEEWKAGVKTSSHIRDGESATFNEQANPSKTSIRVSAGIDKAPNVFLGCYFVKDSEEKVEGKGWWHA